MTENERGRQILYVDSSALVTAYVRDEPENSAMRHLLFRGPEPIVTSEISRVELAGSFVRAARARRIRRGRDAMRLFDHQCRPGGAIALIPLAREQVMADAYGISATHGLRALDSVHIAVALALVDDTSAPVHFVTRDEEQALAARAEGLTVV